MTEVLTPCKNCLQEMLDAQAARRVQIEAYQVELAAIDLAMKASTGPVTLEEVKAVEQPAAEEEKPAAAKPKGSSKKATATEPKPAPEPAVEAPAGEPAAEASSTPSE